MCSFCVSQLPALPSSSRAVVVEQRLFSMETTIHPYCVSQMPALPSNSRTVVAEQRLFSMETTMCTKFSSSYLDFNSCTCKQTPIKTRGQAPVTNNDDQLTSSRRSSRRRHSSSILPHEYSCGLHAYEETPFSPNIHLHQLASCRC